jgi:hypothetical protein
MNKPMIRIHNVETNEITDREMNAAEYTQHLKDIENYQAEQVEAEAKATQKAALLERLGITEDEARLLLG